MHVIIPFVVSAEVVLIHRAVMFLLCRVFVNRSVSMDKIKYIGFDMDHTLVG